MSIPVRFKFYDDKGNFLAERGIFTISYGNDPNSLNILSSRLQECSIKNHREYIGEKVRYAVPSHIPDYMFDLTDPKAIMPNRFK